MKVVAVEMGFYKGNRKRIGAMFDLAEGERVPKWAKEVGDADEAAAESVKVKAAAVKKQADGAKAASGGAAAKAKADAMNESF